MARVGHVAFPPEVAADAEAPSVKRARRGNFDLNFFDYFNFDFLHAIDSAIFLFHNLISLRGNYKGISLRGRKGLDFCDNIV